MEALGINAGLLAIQIVAALILIGFPIVSLIDLAGKKLTGTSLVLWVLVICAVPFLGPLAYWIVKPAAEITI